MRFPALSVTLTPSVCLPGFTLAVFQFTDNVDFVVEVTRLPSIRKTILATPDLASVALIATLTMPLTLALLAGFSVTAGAAVSTCTSWVVTALLLPALSMATNLSHLLAVRLSGALYSGL